MWVDGSQGQREVTPLIKNVTGLLEVLRSRCPLSCVNFPGPGPVRPVHAHAGAYYSIQPTADTGPISTLGVSVNANPLTDRAA